MFFSANSMVRRAFDPVILLGLLVVAFATAYFLVSSDFSLIYGSGFVYSSVAAILVSRLWLKNTLISLAGLLLALTASEIVLSFMDSDEQRAQRQAARYVKGYSVPLRRNGGELGFQPYPGRRVRAWKTQEDQEVYDVVYTITEDGYRDTPSVGDARIPETPIVFYGGSMAFGEGVNDNETLAYFVGEGIYWHRPVLNLGFSGYGPHQMLRSVELQQLNELGFQSVSLAIYEAIPDHAYRASGESWWDPIGPKYVLQPTGTVQYQGRFNNVTDQYIKLYYRYLQVSRVARRSRLLDRVARIFQGSRSSDPKGKADLMTAIVGQCASLLKENYQAEFVVLFWDDKSEMSSLILQGLSQRNIPTIRISEIIPDTERDSYRIPHDPHPTPAANRLVAKELLTRLELDK